MFADSTNVKICSPINVKEKNLGDIKISVFKMFKR